MYRKHRLPGCCGSRKPMPQLFTPAICDGTEKAPIVEKVLVTCSACEEPNDSTNRFCVCCGAKLVVGSAKNPKIQRHRLFNLFKSLATFRSVHCFSDEDIDFYLRQTDCSISLCKFGCNADLAKMYLAAHFLTLGHKQSLQLQSEFEQVINGDPAAPQRFDGSTITGASLDLTVWGRHLRTTIIPVVKPTGMMGF